MRPTLRTALVLCLGAEAVAACGRRAANSHTDTPPPPDVTAADSSTPASAPADTTATPPTITQFAHGEASLTYGTPLNWRLVEGKLTEAPNAWNGEVESIQLLFSPTGQLRGHNSLELHAGRRNTGGYNTNDVMIESAHGDWHWFISHAGQCTTVVSAVGTSGVRGTITCTGDPKGPTGPITFSATP